MGINYLSVSVASTALSFVGLQVLTELSLDKLISNGMIAKKSISLTDSDHALDLLLASYFTIALLAIFVLNVYILLLLSLKTLFFGDLFSVEAKTLVLRLANYIIYKMFQALARDRLERLNASPSSTPRTYFRAYSVLFLVLSVDFLWIKLALMTYSTIGSSVYLLLLFEPCSIAFETLQALLIHGFQLLDMWINHLAVKNSDCRKSKFLDSMTAGSLLEWKDLLNRHLGFVLDMATLVMALAHFLYIWWLHGLAFPVVDAVLLLYVRALLRVILKRIKGYIKLRTALGSLHAALPDATSEEFRAYDDECAICREPMGKAKKLHCNHLFHLGCLRSWLDQGLNEVYSCPTCRKPLFAGRTENEANPRTTEVSSDELLARQLERQNSPGHPLATGLFPADIPNPIESDPSRFSSFFFNDLLNQSNSLLYYLMITLFFLQNRDLGLDPSWLQAWSGQGVDMAGPSRASRSVGLGRVHMMMRHLASVGESYAQNALDDAAWSLWPMSPSQASTSSATVPPGGGGRTGGGLHLRSVSSGTNESLANILAMAETVREVMPHVPDEIIFQDLQRTNSVAVTVNNLLQM
ncbi:E3 ubiquitin protein ligase RIN2-like isoform X1 [Brassica napus]|nr:E3 ubiquitin protein ligase RIN2-like isoform X1 [Brassica napus]XP_048600133.1 E3 ubiquitin protein ligase RIN2-like isoform X1 [Brassica napus]XP_048600134.1 E3 ubiquitin protein ligase RIN2-like isoform X1 [Brassica napus]